VPNPSCSNIRTGGGDGGEPRKAFCGLVNQSAIIEGIGLVGITTEALTGRCYHDDDLYDKGLCPSEFFDLPQETMSGFGGLSLSAWQSEYSKVVYGQAGRITQDLLRKGVSTFVYPIHAGVNEAAISWRQCVQSKFATKSTLFKGAQKVFCFEHEFMEAKDKHPTACSVTTVSQRTPQGFCSDTEGGPFCHKLQNGSTFSFHPKHSNFATIWILVYPPKSKNSTKAFVFYKGVKSSSDPCKGFDNFVIDHLTAQERGSDIRYTMEVLDLTEHTPRWTGPKSTSLK
jgi:hypothetical protein